MREVIIFLSVGVAGIIIGLCFGYVSGCERSYKQGSKKNDSS